MARIQILNLPGDGHPFALIIDQMNWPDATASFTGQANAMAEQTGARGVLLFEDTIEITGPDSTPATASDESGVDWEKAAARNGQLYSAYENQRDDARQGLTDLRARMSAVADKLDDPAPNLLGVGPMRVFAASLIREALDGAGNTT